MSVTLTGPVCDGGRCAQVLAGIAEAKVRLTDGAAARDKAVLDEVFADAELALDERQRGVWPAAVVRAIQRVLGGGES